MIKNLRFFVVSICALLAGTAMAGSITFGELGLENGVQYTNPFDGGDFTVTFGGGGNNGKYYTTGEGIRVYGDGTMTIAAKEGKLKNILITYDGSNKPTEATVVDGGTYDPATGLWTGDASQIVFTRPSGSGHWRVKKIEMGDNVAPVVVTEGQTPETAITVDRALELINALNDGGKTSENYYVKGTVTSITEVSSTYGNASFVIDGKLTAYRLKGLENKKVTNEDFIDVDDVVVVHGQLQKYVKDNVTTPQVAQDGYVYSVNGKTKDESVVEPTIEGGTTPETAITVEAAVAAINSMMNNQTTTNSYYIKGVVTAVATIDTSYGNATFTIRSSAEAQDSLLVYRALGLENKSITDSELLEDGDEVVVYGKLQKYLKDEKITPELAQGGYIYSINGKTKGDDKPIVLEGDGTIESPYTIADLKAMPVPTESSAVEGQEMFWVKGFIAGSLNSSGSEILEGEKIVASNIGLASTQEVASGTECIPVQLPTGNLRAALNVLDNPTYVGKEVLVYGYILKYMGKTGIKNTADFILDGEQFSAGISETKTDNRFQGAIYNLRGQRVMTPAKGLYIMNGKKFFVK